MFLTQFVIASPWHLDDKELRRDAHNPSSEFWDTVFQNNLIRPH